MRWPFRSTVAENAELIWQVLATEPETWWYSEDVARVAGLRHARVYAPLSRLEVNGEIESRHEGRRGGRPDRRRLYRIRDARPAV